jgi:hypothetical protein
VKLWGRFLLPAPSLAIWNKPRAAMNRSPRIMANRRISNYFAPNVSPERRALIGAILRKIGMPEWIPLGINLKAAKPLGLVRRDRPCPYRRGYRAGMRLAAAHETGSVPWSNCEALANAINVGSSRHC